MSSDMQYVDGASHEEGGVQLPTGDEVEGGEVIEQTGSPTDPSERVFSKELHVQGNDQLPTYAEVAEKIAEQKAQIEQGLQMIAQKRDAMTMYMEKKSMPERSRLERDVEKLSAQELQMQQQLKQIQEASDELFQMQEQHAQQMGYRDENGQPNQYVDEGMGQEEGMEQDPSMMQEEQPYRYGGLRKMYATAGILTDSSMSNRENKNTFSTDVSGIGNAQPYTGAIAGAGAGALAGVSLGASIGSIGGPLGAAGGAIIGAAAGTITGLVKKKQMRKEEAARQQAAEDSYQRGITNNDRIDNQYIQDFDNNASTLADTDYYARTGGRLDRGGFTQMQGLSYGADLLSSGAQYIGNLDTYNAMSRFRPQRQVNPKVGKFDTTVNTQSQENAIRGSYGKAREHLENNTSNASVQRAYLGRLAGQEGEGIANIRQQGDAARRQLRNQNVQLGNQEAAQNYQLEEAYQDKLRGFNIGLANMRAGISDKAFSDVNRITNRMGSDWQNNREVDMYIDSYSDPAVRNRMDKSYYRNLWGKDNKQAPLSTSASTVSETAATNINNLTANKQKRDMDAILDKNIKDGLPEVNNSTISLAGGNNKYAESVARRNGTVVDPMTEIENDVNLRTVQHGKEPRINPFANLEPIKPALSEMDYRLNKATNSADALIKRSNEAETAENNSLLQKRDTDRYSRNENPDMPHGYETSNNQKELDRLRKEVEGIEVNVPDETERIDGDIKRILSKDRYDYDGIEKLQQQDQDEQLEWLRQEFSRLKPISPKYRTNESVIKGRTKLDKPSVQKDIPTLYDKEQNQEYREELSAKEERVDHLDLYNSWLDTLSPDDINNLSGDMLTMDDFIKATKAGITPREYKKKNKITYRK
jgi:outer membrane lipoprotein SlyB